MTTQPQDHATIGRFVGGPLNGQLLPLGPDDGQEIIRAYGDGQVVYRQVGQLENTGPDDGAPTATYRFVETTD
ncbi:response regulator [Pseudoclavibacter caeni]|jgi:hypothetical protein|uniref:Response regulator n=1 Tax=Pseudoclavibacter caeni TaxID=908846 RepID=A0A7C8BP15_9MICO|nr:response regulator [Pseudoclavibacter caeni]KAB1633403.1 response regulator [Pseudoclavibacter caeni]NYJ96614.1 hypothetical protein [Pseudoclavibacter caeni]